jgi:hypothetical protein
VPLAALTLVLAQLLDFATFTTMIERHGPGAEANPLVAWLLAQFGVPLLLVAKVTVVALVTAIVAVLVDSARERPHVRLAASLFGVGIVAGLVGGLSNALATV